MKRRRKDFIEILLFGFVLSTVILTVAQIIGNILYYLFKSNFLSFEYNFKIFLSFDIILLILSLILGLIYVFWFFEYKKHPDGRERKTKRH